MFGLPLSFAAPLVLAGLIALPAIWLLLRVTPPQPRRIAFPPLKIMADLMARKESPARTPWWLLLLRLVIAALLILAAAGPVLNPAPSLEGNRDAPVLMIVDNGAGAAADWRKRAAIMLEQGEAIARDGRSIGVLATANPVAEVELEAPAAALERLRAVNAQPHFPEAEKLRRPISAFLASHPDAAILWIADGVAASDTGDLAMLLAEEAQDHALTVMHEAPAPALALSNPQNTAQGLSIAVQRAAPNARDEGQVRATDLRGLPIAEATFVFMPDETRTEARFEIPVELRNDIARIDIVDESSAAATSLLDSRSRRSRVGIVAGTSLDLAQPLLAPTFYLERALEPYADLQEGRGGSAEAVETLLDDQVSVLVLADIGVLPRDTQARVARFVEEGGLLIRFAGPRLTGNVDDLVPVRLREGGRSLGGALSWDAPRSLAPFPEHSPFHGLPLPEDLGIARQILAEPSGELTERTWAALEDGTPIVTADQRGDGMIVLYHVTADASWSNLPLTGLFVEMLRQTLQFAAAPQAAGLTESAADRQPVSPRLTLDGAGNLGTPPGHARSITRAYDERARFDHPPGLYGPQEAAIAVNALAPGDALAPVDFALLEARTMPLQLSETVDLRAPLLVTAFMLLLIDTIMTMLLSGYAGAFAARLRRAAPGLGALLIGAATLFAPQPAQAELNEHLEAAMVTRLAYVRTHDDRVDDISRAGLDGLSRALAARTALEPGAPMGVDIESDELAFFPVLYWPIVPHAPMPSSEAMQRIDAYMRGGGMIVFDTRDAATNWRPGSTTSPEADYLRRLLADVDVPPLEPLPPDHVLTKTFFILDELPGRHSSGVTWVEELPPAPAEDGMRPARAGDAVSPIIITANDLAGAWAVGSRGEAMLPVAGSDPRQREMAFRAGMNIVMYALTGNYKADQVHVPALLERLGN